MRLRLISCGDESCYASGAFCDRPCDDLSHGGGWPYVLNLLALRVTCSRSGILPGRVENHPGKFGSLSRNRRHLKPKPS